MEKMNFEQPTDKEGMNYNIVRITGTDIVRARKAVERLQKLGFETSLYFHSLDLRGSEQDATGHPGLFNLEVTIPEGTDSKKEKAAERAVLKVNNDYDLRAKEAGQITAYKYNDKGKEIPFSIDSEN